MPSLPSTVTNNFDLHHHLDNALGVEGLDARLVREMVKWYFKVIHDKHHSLFHQPSFEKDLERNAIPEVIVHAMIALGAR